MANILIVDDEKSIRATLREFLIKNGHSVDTAEDAFVALDYLKNQAYDIMITDIIMPNMSGLDLLEQTSEIYSEMKVIIITGFPSFETNEQSISKNAFDYINKPILKRDLINVIDQALYMKSINDAMLVRKKKNQSIIQNNQALNIILAINESHDLYTAKHQYRVGNLASDIAKEMGKDSKIIQLVKEAGYLHDIGKIKIPTVILNKTSKLNILEKQLLSTHPSLGFEILQSLKIPLDICNVVLKHHQHLDGSGYPQGISGFHINEADQILIVANKVDSLSYSRPYKFGLSRDVVLSQIIEGAGTLFHPNVANACSRILKDNNYMASDECL